MKLPVKGQSQSQREININEYGRELLESYSEKLNQYGHVIN